LDQVSGLAACPLSGTLLIFSQAKKKLEITVTSKNYLEVVDQSVPFLLSIRLKDCVPCETLRAAIAMINTETLRPHEKVNIVDFEINDQRQIFEFQFGLLGFPSLYKVFKREIVAGWAGLGHEETVSEVSDFLVEVGQVASHNGEN
jgi:thioredoxin-like negative regulator of GroEL